MPYVELSSFLVALRRKPTYGPLAPELLILTATRAQEVRLATCDESDLDARFGRASTRSASRARCSSFRIEALPGALRVVARPPGHPR